MCISYSYFDHIFLGTGYGLFSATDGGRDVDFPIGHPKYLPPEVVVAGPRGAAAASAAADDVVDMGGSFDDRRTGIEGGPRDGDLARKGNRFSFSFHCLPFFTCFSSRPSSFVSSYSVIFSLFFSFPIAIAIALFYTIVPFQAIVFFDTIALSFVLVPLRFRFSHPPPSFFSTPHRFFRLAQSGRFLCGIAVVGGVSRLRSLVLPQFAANLLQDHVLCQPQPASPRRHSEGSQRRVQVQLPAGR